MKVDVFYKNLIAQERVELLFQLHFFANKSGNLDHQEKDGGS